MTTLLPVPRIEIGAGRLDGLGADARALAVGAARALVMLDPALAAGGLPARIEAALAGAGVATTLHVDPPGEPTEEQIDAAANVARAQGASLVVGVGGGSVMDTAKLVAAIAPAAPGAGHYQFCRHPLPPAPLPVICVPTTAGTGSETTTTSVFLNQAGKKAWAWGAELRAAAVILDPTLSVGLPPALTAATGVDALTHAIEAATNRNRSDANDLFALEAIHLIARWLPEAVAHPGDLAAREAMLRASCLAGVAINNAGTAIAHCVAHALGSLGRVHHGRAAGLGLRASLAWNIAEGQPNYARVAAAMGGPEDAQALPGLVDALIRRVGLKVALADELPSVTPATLAREMARPENDSMRKSNLRVAGDEDLLAIARAVLSAA
jgi:alcohol dehydrogenase class IV